VTASPDPTADVVPIGDLRLQALYARLFRPAILGPAAVVALTVLGGLVGLKIFAAAWPLLALAVGGTAAALWRILVGDRSHAGDLVRWRDDQLAYSQAAKSKVKPGAGDAADVAADRFAEAFTSTGDADPTEWQAAVAHLRPDRARFHKASLAIYEAAVDLAEHRPWLIRLDKAALELGPFEIAPLQRIERRLVPVVPVLLGIAIDAVIVLALGPNLAL
jgi:hypothetical protein